MGFAFWLKIWIIDRIHKIGLFSLEGESLCNRWFAFWLLVIYFAWLDLHLYGDDFYFLRFWNQNANLHLKLWSTRWIRSGTKDSFHSQNVILRGLRFNHLVKCESLCEDMHFYLLVINIAYLYLHLEMNRNNLNYLRFWE